MATRLPKDRVVAAVAHQFRALDTLLEALDEADWSLPTACPGWDVHSNVAHIYGTEAMLDGQPNPEVDLDVSALDHVRNDIGAFNEAWVQALAPVPPAELTARLRALVARRLAALGEMDQQTWDTEGFTPAGPDSYGRFMRIRVFDCWMHEQDIRVATGRPGHDGGPAVEECLDEIAASLGFVVGKKAAAPRGSSVTFDLTGPAPRRIHVLVGDRARTVDALAGDATTTLRLPVLALARRVGGRADAPRAGEVEIEGDPSLGRAVLDNLAYMI